MSSSKSTMQTTRGSNNDYRGRDNDNDADAADGPPSVDGVDGTHRRFTDDPEAQERPRYGILLFFALASAYRKV